MYYIVFENKVNKTTEQNVMRGAVYNMSKPGQQIFSYSFITALLSYETLKFSLQESDL